MTVILLLARFLLGSVFVVSGWGKLRSRGEMLSHVNDYEVLPPSLARLAALALPFLELAAGTSCLLGLALPLAGTALFVLLLAFNVAIAINVRRGRVFNCHCFGSGGAEIGLPIIVRNGVFMVLAAVLVLAAPRMSSYAASITDWHAAAQLLSSPSILVPVLGILLLSFGIVVVVNAATEAALFGSGG